MRFGASGRADWLTRHAAVAIACLALAAVLLPGAHGCARRSDCLAGDDGKCTPPSACEAVQFECEDHDLELSLLANASERPAGPDALASTGDYRIANSRFVAVIDGIGSRHHLAPSGGALLDLAARGPDAGDHLNLAYQAAGILPHDAARYRSVDVIDERPARVALVFRGHLDLRPDFDIVTRYEARPCEPGLRVSTELYNGGRDPLTVMLSDGFYWGDREVTPFVPLRGRGFTHPDLDLETIGDAFCSSPFVAAQAHSSPGGSYAVVPCGRPALDGFHSTTLSAIGAPRRILMPGDGTELQRFIAVSGGRGLQGAVDEALELRSQLFGTRVARVRGRTVRPDGTPVGDDERAIDLEFYEPALGSDPDANASRKPWSEVVPGPDGRFELLLPAERSYRYERHVLGRALPERGEFDLGTDEMDLGDIVVPATSTLHITVRSQSGEPLVSEIVMRPKLPTTAADVGGSIFGVFDEARCAPYLGPPHAGSPACNRVLVGPSGEVDFAVPPGSFHVYATHGPFWTLAEQDVTLAAGETRDASFVLEPLPLLPPGTLSADFHVHAAASFDSSFPERDRALSFVASGVDVIAATDHDVVTDYTNVLAKLGLSDRVAVMPGVETTGEILFLYPPGADVPRVVGHFNFWPLRYDPNLPRNGAPDDERLEPGALFDRVAALYDGVGVAELNHPYSNTDLGRDNGYLSAIEYDPRLPVPDHDDGTNAGQLARRPGGGKRNIDFDAEEVMNGSGVQKFLQYRTLWFSFLRQGIVRAGTANSDSHTLATDVLGYPRNLVFTSQSLQGFDRDAFNTEVRAGHLEGSNGPVIEACVELADGSCVAPGRDAVTPSPDGSLRLTVRAAPWIPVDEIRVIVNGDVVATLPATAMPADPFGTQGLVRYDGALPLSDLVGGIPGDAFLIVEAGMALPSVTSIDDHGLPQTKELKRAEHGDPRFHYDSIAPYCLPTAFTDPWLLDLDGGGWRAPGLRP